MNIVVLKFGGTSVASINNLKNVVKIINAEYEAGNFPVIIVSAMAGVTNQLVAYTQEAANLDNEEKLAEYDVAIASGEQVTASLMSLLLQEEGYQARSLLGWQVPINTCNNYSNSNILNIDKTNLSELIDNKIIPVIAGFQGIAANNRITTIGRGGSDTSAVAVACHLKATKCDIYSDVDGVFSADPHIVQNAIKYDHIGLEQMYKFAKLGSKIVNEKAMQIAYQHNMILNVKSSFSKNLGTKISNENDLKFFGISKYKDSIFYKLNKEYYEILISYLKQYNINYFEYSYNQNNFILAITRVKDNFFKKNILKYHIKKVTSYDNLELVNILLSNDFNKFHNHDICKILNQEFEDIDIVENSNEIHCLIKKDQANSLVKYAHQVIDEIYK